LWFKQHDLLPSESLALGSQCFFLGTNFVMFMTKKIGKVYIFIYIYIYLFIYFNLFLSINLTHFVNFLKKNHQSFKTTKLKKKTLGMAPPLEGPICPSYISSGSFVCSTSIYTMLFVLFSILNLIIWPMDLECHHSMIKLLRASS